MTNTMGNHIVEGTDYSRVNGKLVRTHTHDKLSKIEIKNIPNRESSNQTSEYFLNQVEKLLY